MGFQIASKSDANKNLSGLLEAQVPMNNADGPGPVEMNRGKTKVTETQQALGKGPI